MTIDLTMCPSSAHKMMMAWCTCPLKNSSRVPVKGACDVTPTSWQQPSVQDDAAMAWSHWSEACCHYTSVVLAEYSLSPSTAAHLDSRDGTDALLCWMRRLSAIPAIVVPIVVPIVGMRAIDDARDVLIVASERHVHLAVVKPWDFLQVAHHVVGP